MRSTLVYRSTNDQHLSFETTLLGSILSYLRGRFTRMFQNTCRFRDILVFQLITNNTSFIDQNRRRTEIDGDAFE